MKPMNKYFHFHYSCIVTLCVVCYSNSLTGDFTFDDVWAVINNKDLKPETPVSNLFWNDFWGTPMSKNHSHKSYRPLCVLSFRLNYALNELSPVIFHSTNLILHIAVCLLLLHVYSLFVSTRCSFVASCLFAVHPIHTEAVTGIVGRAELLSAVFYLCAFISYTKCTGRHRRTKWPWLLSTMVSVVMAMISKEQGVTVIGVCCVYEVFVAQRVNGNNAKIWTNVGHVLEKMQKYDEALAYYKKALSIQPDVIATYVYLGRTYQSMGRYSEAEVALWKMVSFIPPLVAGEPMWFKISTTGLMAFNLLGNILAMNDSRLEEADQLFRKALKFRLDYVPLFIDRGNLLVKMNRSREAEAHYKLALTHEPDNSNALYNIGVVVSKDPTRQKEALSFFSAVLKLKPKHEASLLNSVSCIQSLNDPALRLEAFSRLDLLHSITPNDPRVYYSKGLLHMLDSRYDQAESNYIKSLEIDPNHTSSLLNLAIILMNNMNRPLDAIPYLHRLIKIDPNHTGGLDLMGGINMNVLKNYTAAEANYRQILRIDPGDINAHHNLCIVFVVRGDYTQGERCLTRVHDIAPSVQYITDHLYIVRSNIQSGYYTI